jgi:predicted nucleic acid-binding protein
MSSPIAAIDSDVLIWLLDTSTTPTAARCRGYIELTIERMDKQNARWVVPAPVVAELCREGPGSGQLREITRIALRRLRVEVLDLGAADVAGQIMRMALRARAPGRERGAVKFDALIAAIAHKIGARWLLTANGRDMRAHLSAIDSTVEVVVATEPPSTGQTVMLEILKPGAESSK